MSQFRVALLQHQIEWCDVAANLQALEQQLTALLDQSLQLVLLAETFATGFAFAEPGVAEPVGGEVFCWLQQQAKRLNTTIAATVAVEQNHKAVNRLYCCIPMVVMTIMTKSIYSAPAMNNST